MPHVSRLCRVGRDVSVGSKIMVENKVLSCNHDSRDTCRMILKASYVCLSCTQLCEAFVFIALLFFNYKYNVIHSHPSPSEMHTKWLTRAGGSVTAGGEESWYQEHHSPLETAYAFDSAGRAGIAQAPLEAERFQG